jgi:hypothetical protein
LKITRGHKAHELLFFVCSAPLRSSISLTYLVNMSTPSQSGTAHHSDPAYYSNNGSYPPVQEPYEDSESHTNGERFEDEPGLYNQEGRFDPNDPYSNNNNQHQDGPSRYGDDYHNAADATSYHPDATASSRSYQPDVQSNADPYYAQSQDGHCDDLRTGEEEDPYNNRSYGDQNNQAFDNHDPYAQPAPHANNRAYQDDSHQDAYYDEPPPEQAPPPPQRQHKYSTSNMNETGKWKKWCSICCMFLLMLAFMIGLSMLFDYLFFGDQSDNGPQTTQRSENETFNKDKQEIDSACGRSTFLRDQGALCQQACVPQYFDCCDPFDEFKLYNFTKGSPKKNATANETALSPNVTNLMNMTNTTNTTSPFSKETTNTTYPDLSSDKYDLSDDKNTSFLDPYRDLDNLTCSFDEEVRGCMAYAKCQALSGQADPSPANLPEMCAFEQLEKDPDACQELCRKLDCCYSRGTDNCLADKFDLCMDYAPCQNLRHLDAGGAVVVETAPRTLDYDCFWQLQGCYDACEKASCCSDTDNSCFKANFLSCLTYAPCTNVTETTNIAFPPQFSHVPKPPNDIIYACNAKHEPVLQATDQTCGEYCSTVACCLSDDPGQNCFHLDPLGCMAWDAQCQVLLDQA